MLDGFCLRCSQIDGKTYIFNRAAVQNKNNLNKAKINFQFSEMKYKIAVFPGYGVGPELIKKGMKVINKAAELDKFVELHG